MSPPDEMFPQTAVEKLQAIRAHLIAESAKAEEAAERAGQKVAEAHARLYMMNEAIESAVASEKAAKGIISYDVDLGSGEVLP